MCKEVNEKLQEKNLEVVSKKKLTKIFSELFVVALFLGLGTSSIITGFAALFFPCNGSVCGEVELVGALFVFFGFLSCAIAAIVILMANLFAE